MGRKATHPLQAPIRAEQKKSTAGTVFNGRHMIAYSVPAKMSSQAGDYIHNTHSWHPSHAPHAEAQAAMVWRSGECAALARMYCNGCNAIDAGIGMLYLVSPTGIAASR